MHVPFGDWNAIVASPHQDATPLTVRIIFKFSDQPPVMKQTKGYRISDTECWLQGWLVGVDVDDIVVDGQPSSISIFVCDDCMSRSNLMETTIHEKQFASYSFYNGKFRNAYGLFNPVHENFVSGWKVCVCVP